MLAMMNYEYKESVKNFCLIVCVCKYHPKRCYNKKKIESYRAIKALYTTSPPTHCYIINNGKFFLFHYY